ncbi:MAG: ATP-dependent DNA helicase RecG [Coriobacteriales bacterium]|nr:ATP-dependent DNA helicase RecG [Coriobacteriales bacterium]
MIAESNEGGENDGASGGAPPASSSTGIAPVAASVAAGSILPVYGTTATLSSAWIARLVREALDTLPALLDPLPPTLRNEQGLLSRHAALRAIHFPASQDERLQANRRLAFEELLYLQLFFRMRRQVEKASSTPYRHVTEGPGLARLQANLPFSLTADQQTSIEELRANMALPQSMNRLLMGDVGSGKTIVAAHALAMVADSGWQAAMMAPTEVLAQQYALKLGPLLDTAGIRWGLLTSSVDKASRAALLQSLADGSCCVAFGTHALLEPDVRFRQLSLVVIDEQHRFGVAQRQALKSKGLGCDLLAMTATPIPRSLALVLYGDMETSSLRTRPQSATSTSTRILRKSLRGKAYAAIGDAVAAGHQAYIICPLITNPNDPESAPSPNATASHSDVLIDSETPPELLTEFSDEQDTDHIAAAEQEVAFLKAKVFPAQNIGLMTSRLKPQAKRKVMDDFREGRIDILVSTTVVEVGVDVPNATVMLIEDADRFGLSQLHQLRGRVGRGQWDAQVFLISNAKGEDAIARLKALEKTTDGFKLAEYDLELRREGDVLGSRQHGAAALKLINVIRDGALIALAHKEAQAILDADPQLELPQHRHLAYELTKRSVEDSPCTS